MLINLDDTRLLAPLSQLGNPHEMAISWWSCKRTDITWREYVISRKRKSVRECKLETWVIIHISALLLGDMLLGLI